MKPLDVNIPVRTQMNGLLGVSRNMKDVGWSDQ